MVFLVATELFLGLLSVAEMLAIMAAIVAGGMVIAAFGAWTYTKIEDWKQNHGIHILVLGRPASGKSMLIRSLQGKLCQPSTRQTNGVEHVEAWKVPYENKTLNFAQTSDIGGSRINQECSVDSNGKSKPSVVQELLPFAERIYFLCNIQEYAENKIDPNIQMPVREDVLERIGQVARLKNSNASLSIIFSYADCIKKKEKEKSIEHLKSQLNTALYKDVKYYEVDFMNENSTKALIGKLFDK